MEEYLRCYFDTSCRKAAEESRKWELPSLPVAPEGCIYHQRCPVGRIIVENKPESREALIKLLQEKNIDLSSIIEA